MAMIRFSLVLFLSLTPRLPMVVSEPHLSLHVTNDVTFNCTMAGFHGTFHSLLSLKIIQRNVPRNVSVLATVSGSSDPRTSATFQNNHPNFYVSWHVRSVYACDSWLGLTIINVGSRHGGVYACQINYLENAGDRFSTWESSNLSWHGRDNLDAQRVPGFSVKSQRGVQAVCQQDLDDANITSMVISSQDGQRWASHSSEGLAKEGLVDVTFRPENSMLEAHVVDVGCEDTAEFHCTVNTTSSGRLESSPQRLPADGCPTVPPSTTPRQDTSAGVESTEPGPSGDGSATDHSQQEAEQTWKILVPVVVILAIVCLCITIFRVWRHRKLKGLVGGKQLVDGNTNGKGDAGKYETNSGSMKRSKDDSTDSQKDTHKDDGGHLSNPTTSTRRNGDNANDTNDITRDLAVRLRNQQHNIGGGRPTDEPDHSHAPLLKGNAGCGGSARTSTSSDSYHSVQEGEHREGGSSRESAQTPAGGHMPQQVVDLRNPPMEV